MFILGHDAEVADWLGNLLRVPRFAEPYVTIGVLRDGGLVGAALFNNYRHPNIEITFASARPGWATKGTVRGILAYPFLQLNCRRITATTEATNQPTRAFLGRIGFTEEGYHPDVFPDGDAVSYGLLRRNCRWLEETRGKISAVATASA